jgi:hypothetical protein
MASPCTATHARQKLTLDALSRTINKKFLSVHLHRAALPKLTHSEQMYGRPLAAPWGYSSASGSNAMPAAAHRSSGVL